MFFAVLNLVTALMAPSSFAGGLECQLNGTCQCLVERTCDKEGNPIPRESLQAGPVIQCGEGSEAFRVKLGQPFSQMPREGEVPAEFENLSLVRGESVSTQILPIFHMRLISFQTAYCGYGIQVSSAGEGKYYVFRSSVECEGESREISCRVL